MNAIDPTLAHGHPLAAPARPTAHDRLRDKVLTITSTESAEAMAAHLDPSYEGLVITGADRLSKMRRLRRVFPELLLIAEPDSHSKFEATPDALWHLPDGEGDLLPAPTLEDILDGQRQSGASIVLPPSGFIDVGDADTLRATVQAANKLAGDDIAVPLYLASGWLRPEHTNFLIAVMKLSTHPVLLSFGSSTNPLSTGRRHEIYRDVVVSGGVVSWRTDLAGLEALAHGALGAAIGAAPGLRRFTPPKDSGKARRPDDPSPYVMIPRHMHYMKTGAMREELYVSAPAPSCRCRECGGQRVDRFTEKQKDAAARHNHAVIDEYARAILDADSRRRPLVWRGMVHDALVAHEATAATVGRPWNAPLDVTVWAES